MHGKKLPLAVNILLGMVIGVFTGIILSLLRPATEVTGFIGMSFFHLGGLLFLNMFRMVIAPIVLVSMISGITSMSNLKLLGRTGLKTVILFVITTVLSAFLGIAVAKSVHLGVGMEIELPASIETTQTLGLSLLDTIGKIVPENAFKSVVDGDLLQVIFIAIVIGMALLMLPEKHKHGILSLLSELDKLNTKIIEITLSVAPLGVFCLMTETFGNFGIKAVLPLASYLLCILVAVLIVIFVFYSLLLHFFARISPFKFFCKYFPVMLFAFSSSSGNATLPMNIHTVTDEMGVDKSLGTFILSLGTTVNMNGTAIMQCCATIFIANLYHVDLSFMQLVQIVVLCLISSIGTAGMPGSGIIMLGIVLQSMNIPIEGTAIILGVDRIVDMIRTATNVTGNAIASIVVANSEKRFDRKKFNRMASLPLRSKD